ncbi:MAG: cupin domain-containing protein [Pseudomonadota bacterium]
MSAHATDVITNASDRPESRARFEDPENFFAFKWPEVPRHLFVKEREQAFAETAKTGEIALDVSDQLQTPYAATTPLLLARYVVVRANTTLDVDRLASAEIFYVMKGRGESAGHGDTMAWDAGDVFMFPGGAVQHRAETDAVLFTVCNEPLLRYESCVPNPAGHARVFPTVWKKSETDRHFEPILNRPDTEETAGRALQLTTAAMSPAKHPVPTINVAFNTLEPGKNQRPHRHNGVAITLAIVGDGVHSMIEDQQVDWQNGVAMITPATELHSHHNRGERRMESIVFQDEGLHFYTRTPGFSWT